MTRVALLCWEAGGGLGHGVALTKVGHALQMRGWRAVLALPGDRTPADLRTGGLTICPAPRWSDGVSAGPQKKQSSASLGDVLAQLGLQSAECVRRQIAGWHQLFASYSPDLIVADFAPGAVLAARNRVACVVRGVGFTVPPPGLHRFPRLHDLAAVLYDETAILATVNSVLAEIGSQPIAFLPEVLTGDAQCVCTVPLLDPYASFRLEPVLGPLLSAAVSLRGDDAVDVFCYLHDSPYVSRLDEIADCLRGLPAPVVAYLPGLAGAVRDRLRRKGVNVLDAPAEVARQLVRSRLVVHSGGHGIAAAALLAGVPQVILSSDIEKLLTAQALMRRGIAYQLDYARAEVESVRAGILAALDDPVLEREAIRAADEHEGYRSRDVVSEIAAICERAAEGAAGLQPVVQENRPQ